MSRLGWRVGAPLPGAPVASPPVPVVCVDEDVPSHRRFSPRFVSVKHAQGRVFALTSGGTVVWWPDVQHAQLARASSRSLSGERAPGSGPVARGRGGQGAGGESHRFACRIAGAPRVVARRLPLAGTALRVQGRPPVACLQPGDSLHGYPVTTTWASMADAPRAFPISLADADGGQGTRESTAHIYGSRGKAVLAVS